MNHYQVLFSGDIAEGAQESAVRENLARELGIDERKVAMLFSGRTVVIRSRLSRDEAQALQDRLADLGAIARIKDLTPHSEKKLDYRVDRGERGGENTLRDITAAHVECPRCGHLQLEASHCVRCGIDIAAALNAKRKEDLIIEKKIRELRSRKAAATVNPRFEAGVQADDAQPGERTGLLKSLFKKTS